MEHEACWVSRYMLVVVIRLELDANDLHMFQLSPQPPPSSPPAIKYPEWFDILVPAYPCSVQVTRINVMLSASTLGPQYSN